METQNISFSNLNIDFDDFVGILQTLNIPHSCGTLYDYDENECGRWIDIYDCSLSELYD